MSEIKLSGLEFLSFVTLEFEFGHNCKFRVLSLFKFLSFVAFWVFKFCCYLSFTDVHGKIFWRSYSETSWEYTREIEKEKTEF